MAEIRCPICQLPVEKQRTNIVTPPLSPKRRFLGALLGRRRGPRIPVGNPTSIVTIEIMEMVGVYFPEAHTDPQKMADLASASHEILGFDTVTPYFSVQQEADALGCRVHWGARDMMPEATLRPFKDPRDIRIPSDFLERPSVRVVLEALSLLRRRYADHVAVIGKVMGPWTLSYHVAGVEDFLASIILAPDDVRRYLDVLKEVTIMFARAQARAGADAVVVADHATGDLISPKTYRDFLLPIHREIVSRVGCPMILHICGDNTDRLDYFVQAGFDGYHFESKVDAVTAVETVRGRMCLIGNINNPSTLLYGTPETVRAEAKAAILAGVDILAPECAVPLKVPVANLRAITEAAEEAAGCT